MKSILFAFLFIAAFSYAQPVKGTFVIGGNASFNFSQLPSSTGKLQNTNFSISPGIGHFISSKFLLEYGLSYRIMSTFNSTNQNINSRTNNSNYSIKFGLTRYFQIAEKLYFTVGTYVLPTYEVSSLKNTTFGVETTSRATAFIGSINVSPGLTYFINQKWMLYSYVGVMNYDIKFNLTNDIVSHNFNANISFNSFGLGVRYILGQGTKSE